MTFVPPLHNISIEIESELEIRVIFLSKRMHIFQLIGRRYFSTDQRTNNFKYEECTKVMFPFSIINRHTVNKQSETFLQSYALRNKYPCNKAHPHITRRAACTNTLVTIYSF